MIKPGEEMGSAGTWQSVEIEADVRVAYKDHWEEFQHRWSQLPPLVRASCAAWLITVLDNSADQHARHTARHKVTGLDRRATVSEAFARSDRTVAQLFVALCKEADAEAEAKGIDADIKPEPTKDKFYVATKMWETAPKPSAKKRRKRK